MSKSLYLVDVIPQGLKDDDGQIHALARIAHEVGDSVEPCAGRFVEAIRASNRREAMILVRRKYPGFVVLDKVVKAP
jgi:hypothetical protein